MNRKISLVAAMAVAACAQSSPQDPQLPVVTAEVEQGAAVDVVGETRFAVEATRGGASEAADCVAEGSGFRAAFAAPATLAVPSFGPASQAIRVVCAAGGRQAARLVVPAAAPAGGGYGGVYPTIGIGVGSGGWGGGDWGGVSIGGVFTPGLNTGPGGYGVRYPDVTIPLD